MVAFVPEGRRGGSRVSEEVPAPDLPAGAPGIRTEEGAPAPGIATADEASAGERRNWVPDGGCRIIACVSIEPLTSDQGEPPSRRVLWDLAVRRMERCVRPGDWICMLGGQRLAVCFGNGAHRVTADDLGRRLARAMGGHLAVGSTSTELAVAVGIGIALDDLETAAATRAALASIRTTRRHLGGSHRHASHFVAVSTLPEGAQVHATVRFHGGAVATHGASGLPLVRRTLLRIDVEGSHPQETSDASGSGVPSSAPHPSRRVAAMRVLVVDPEPTPPLASRLGAAAVSTIARRVGAMPTISTAQDLAAVLLDHGVVEPHAAVIVLHPEPAPPSAALAPDPWERAARCTRHLCDLGSSVIAVSFGASALTVAACVEQGAIGLFDVAELPDELARVARRHAKANGNGNGKGNGSGFDSSRFPAPYRGLVDLTPAERRVLYQMMRGRSAAEIGADQVVSLSTVRTHIRSILRKLRVNSQLAAVAIANGSIPLAAPLTA